MLPDRFWAKVEKSATCWLWTASVDGQGYGRFRLNGRQWSAHRLAYTDLLGPIPADMELDHLCRVPTCCNPMHLELVSHVENVRRGLAGRINNYNASKTHCAKGHPYDKANTAIDKDGWRDCRQCSRDKERAKYYATRRLKGTRPMGEQNTQAKLNAQAVRDIRLRHSLGESMNALAREYGMSRTTIQYVIARKTWKHID